MKRPRPQSTQQDTQQVFFYRVLAQELAEIVAEAQEDGYSRPIKHWCQDETRVGLQTILGRRITLNGVKLIQSVR